MKISVIALVIAIIAFVGMAVLIVQMDQIQGRMVSESYVQIGQIDERVLDELLTEEQREAGLHLVRRYDGSVELVQTYAVQPDGVMGVTRAWFSAETSVTRVRLAADAEMLEYLKIGITEWPKGAPIAGIISD